MKKFYSPFCHRTVFVLLFMLTFVRGWGQFSLGVSGTYTQNYNNLSATAAPSPTVTGGSLNNVNSSLNGWYFLEVGSSSNSAYYATDGTINSGDTYSLGATSSTDRALGGVQSGNNVPTIGFYFTNNTGSTITSLKITYTGEQWRLGAVGREDRLDFQYSTGATSLSTGSWIDVNTLDFIAPVTSGALGKLDGNATANRVLISSTITGLSVLNGSKIFIRWNDFNATGTDDTLGVDDFSLEANPAITPTLTLSAASLTDMDYLESFGPSTATKTFTVTGSNLAPANSGNRYVYIEPTGANFEFSLDNTNFYTAGEVIPFPTGNGFSATTVYTRLKAGLSVGNYTDNTSISYYNSPADPLVKTIALSGTVTAPPSPTITLGTFTTTAMTYPLGTGPSASQNASISGSNLTNDITVTPNNTSLWEVSKTGAAGSWGNSAIYTRAGTTIGTGNNIYVRLKSGLAVNTYSGILTASSVGASDKTYNVTGQVFQPVVTVSNNTFSPFTYAEGQGPSANQSFVVSGSNLASDITINVPSARWEIFTNETTPAPTSSLVLSKTASNGVSNTTIYIRLKAGLSQGGYVNNNGLEIVSNSTSTQYKNLDGLVTAPVPFIEIRSTTTPFPRIQNDTNIPLGPQNTLWAARTVNTSEEKTYTIHNLGGSPLTISSATILGANPFDFTVTTQPPSIVAAGGSATFGVTFSPTTYGTRNAILRLVNNSNNISPNFDFNIQGTGNNAEIGVTGNGNAVSNGSITVSSTNNTLIGTANINLANPTTVSKTFVVQNTGNVALAVSSITISGANASQFSVSPTTTSIAANSTGTITVTFAPTSSGVKNAIINIANNDLTDGENHYTFAVQGNAVEYIVCAAGSFGPLQTLAIQDFETPAGNPAWAYTNTSGTVTDGNGFADVASIPKFLDSKSFQINNTTGILNFNFNTTAYEEVELSIRLGAFGSDINNGLDAIANDFVSVEISPDNITWYKQIKVGGFSNARWSYTSGIGVASISYTTGTGIFDVFSEFSPTGGGSRTTDGYSTIRITNLPKSNNLYVKITAKNNAASETWVLDNITLKGKIQAGISEKTWNGTAWSGDGLPPTSTQKAIIADSQTLNLTSDLHVCECEVKTGATLNVGTHNDVTHTSVPANLIVEGNIVNNGTIVLASDSNLQQKNSLAENVFSGTNFIVKRSAKMKKMDYTYWSSPVQGTGATGQRLLNTNDQNLETSSGGFSPTTPNNRIFRYNEPNDYFVGTTDNYFIPGKGYAIRGKNSYGGTKTLDTFSFIGTPNNGDAITVSVQRSPNNAFNHGFNMIGNPYPSGLSFEEFAEDNATSIKGTAWFWSNLEDNFTQSGSTSTKHNNYAVFTLAGGSPPTTGAGGLAEYTPTGNIKVGQGFIVQVRDELASTSLVTRTLSFKNEMRTTGSGVFFNNPAKQSQVKDRYWLRFVSPENVVNTILLAHIEKATDGYDQDYDANLFTLGDDSFYSLLGTRKLQIQAKGAFVQESKIDLGTKQNKNGNYTIKLEQPEGVFANGQAVYLHDKLTGTYTNLLEESFTFSATRGATENRFEIVYKNNQVLATDGVKKSDFTVYRDGTNFVIKSSSVLGKIELYDLGGKLVSATSSTQKEFRLDASGLLSGVYVIRAENSGNARTKKIIKQ